MCSGGDGVRDRCSGKKVFLLVVLRVQYQFIIVAQKEKVRNFFEGEF